MKCNVEWLSAYLDGLLSDDKRAKLEEHLKTCEACAAKLEEFARVEQAAKKIPAPQLSEAYWENFASRVQNKLAIRERQKTSPAWLETLKSFFRPTTGKLAIAGSVAVIILLTFVSLDQWKKETFRPPVFEAETPVVEGKVDSVQIPAKDETAFRTTEKNREVGLVEEKRLDQPTPERATATLSQKPTENAPAASAPLGRALATPEEQKSREEPSLAAFTERDEAIKGDSVHATAEKAEESEKALLQNRGNLQRRSLVAAATKGRIQNGKADDTTLSTDRVEAGTPSGTKVAATEPSAPKESVQEFTLLKGGFDAQYGGKTMPSIDTAQLVADIGRIIAENEKGLADSVSKAKTESLYILLGDYYLSLYRFSQKPGDWKKANRRVNEFLKKELSDSTRQRLLEIQSELKKLKKQ